MTFVDGRQPRLNVFEQHTRVLNPTREHGSIKEHGFREFSCVERPRFGGRAGHLRERALRVSKMKTRRGHTKPSYGQPLRATRDLHLLKVRSHVAREIQLASILKGPAPCEQIMTSDSSCHRLEVRNR